MNKTIKEKPEPNGAARPPQGRRYEEAFKKQAVENWLQSGRPGTQIARELGVSSPTLKQWKRCCWGDARPARPDLESENRVWRVELARVRGPRDIPEKTPGILAVPSRSGMSASKP